MLIISCIRNSAAPWLFRICPRSLRFLQMTPIFFLIDIFHFWRYCFSYSITGNGKSLTLGIIVHTYINPMILSVLLSSQVLRIVEIVTLIQICVPLCLQVALYNLINFMFEVTNVWSVLFSLFRNRRLCWCRISVTASYFFVYKGKNVTMPHWKGFIC